MHFIFFSRLFSIDNQIRVHANCYTCKLYTHYDTEFKKLYNPSDLQINVQFED